MYFENLYSIACLHVRSVTYIFVLVWILVSEIKGNTWIEKVWEQGVEKNICAQEEWNRSLEKTVQLEDS
jgi:hypothetical protein